MSKKAKIRIAVSIIVVLLIICIVYFFRVTKVTIEGNTFYSSADMEKKICNSKLDYNTVSFYIRKMFGHKVDLPFIREYEVSFPSRNEVHIKLYEKTIVSGVKYMNEYVYFDKDGMVLESATKAKDKVPVFEVKGMKRFTLYQVVQMESKDMVDEMLEIANLITHYNITAERIVFDDNNQVVIYSGKVKVILGKGEDHDDAMAALSSVLPKTLEQQLSGTIDMSGYQKADNIILKKK